jgi:hypothetical protein
VPVQHVGAPVIVRLHAERVRFWRDQTLLADHHRAPDGARQRVVDPRHFAPLFGRKPRAQAMLYRDVLVSLGGRAPAFLGRLCQRHRDRLGHELLALYALYEHYGAEEVLAAMALADDAGTDEAAALALLLETPRPALASPAAGALPGLPSQAEVDRRVSVYETWVVVDVAPAWTEVAP